MHTTVTAKSLKLTNLLAWRQELELKYAVLILRVDDRPSICTCEVLALSDWMILCSDDIETLSMTTVLPGAGLKGVPSPRLPRCKLSAEGCWAGES